MLAKARASSGAILSLSLKFVGAGLNLLLFGVASHAMSVHDFGTLAIWFNMLSLIAVISCIGQDGLIVRAWNEYRGLGDQAAAHGAYRFGWIVIATGAAVGGLFVAVVEPLFLPVPATFLLWACAFVVAQTLLHYSSFSCRLVCDFRTAEPLREFPWRVAVFGTIGFHVATGRPFGVEMFLGSAALGMLLAILLQCFFAARRFPAEVAQAPPRVETRLWLRRSLALCFPASLDAASQYAEVILIGVLLDPTAAASYFAASRIANVFPMISTGLAGYGLTNIARYHFENDRSRLQEVYRSSVAIAAPVMIVLLLAILAFGGDLLTFFGPSYRSAYWILVLLVAGTAVLAMAGPAGQSLLVTGHEAVYSRYQVVMMAVRFVLVVTLTPWLGAVGAALALALVSTPYAMALIAANRRLLGADPSVLCLVRRPPGP